MFHDYYDILGLDTEAGSDEIKSAYRKRAREAHPDRHPGDTGAQNEEMTLINEAYAVLSNRQKRTEYDIQWRRYYKTRGQIRRKGGDTAALADKWSDDFELDRPVVQTRTQQPSVSLVPFWKDQRFLFSVLLLLVLILALDVWLTYFRSNAFGSGAFREIAYGYEFALGRGFRDTASNRHVELSRDIPEENIDERFWRLRRALQLNPDNIYAGVELSQILLDTEKYSEALIVSRHALLLLEDLGAMDEYQPRMANIEIHRQHFLGISYKANIGLGEMEAAHTIMTELEETGIRNDKFLIDQAMVEIELNLTGDARDHLDMLLENRPDENLYSAALALYVQSYLIEGEYSQAEEMARSALVEDPDNAVMNHLLGESYFHQGNYTNAVTHLEKGIPGSPDPVNTRYLIGLSAYKAGWVPSATAYLTEVVMIRPDHFDAHLWLGRCYQIVGDNESARNNFYRALEINPESQEARTALDNVPTR